LACHISTSAPSTGRHCSSTTRPLGYRELVTQMYFAGELLNDADLLLRELSAEEQKRVTVSFAHDAGAHRGSFELTLRRV
jgi:protocatechuate 3,4-dioxygenase beta subunit